MNAMMKNPVTEGGGQDLCPRTLARFPLVPDDALSLPMHRRMIVQYGTGDAGQRELRLFHEGKEISFDEPELFAFGEKLAKQSRFRAGDAAKWAKGCDWARAKELLQTLIDEGVLVRDSGDEPHHVQRERPSPLPPATCPHPRAWQEAEAITFDLTGRAVEQGYLELVIPIFRVAHPTLDAEGRQVGEANVFPRPLRLDVPTEWTACPFPGTRYLVDAPMNVTALKTMRDHWEQMMAALHHIRSAFLRRFPDAAGGWTIGHIERLSVSVLAVPTYQLMRTDCPVKNGHLHPALSSLFRVTDGLRMTMHQMLFVPTGEPTLPPTEPMTTDRIYEYADRNYSFHSDTGVCGGPKNMVQEFLRVLIDGDAADRYGRVVLEPDVERALADVDVAIDYALRGLQAYAVGFSLWPLMTRTYERLATIAREAVENGATAFAGLDERMSGHIAHLKRTPYLATETWRTDREAVYADMYARCGEGATGRPVARLPDVIAPAEPANAGTLRGELRRRLESRLPVAAAHAHHVEATLDCVWHYAARTHAILRASVAAQADINALLGRTPPVRAFRAGDMDVHNLLQGRESQRLPFLLDELAAVLGIEFDIDNRRLDLKRGA